MLTDLQKTFLLQPVGFRIRVQWRSGQLATLEEYLREHFEIEAQYPVLVADLLQVFDSVRRIPGFGPSTIKRMRAEINRFTNNELDWITLEGVPQPTEEDRQDALELLCG